VNAAWLSKRPWELTLAERIERARCCVLVALQEIDGMMHEPEREGSHAREICAVAAAQLLEEVQRLEAKARTPRLRLVKGGRR
jgi:hypothetical protein